MAWKNSVLKDGVQKCSKKTPQNSKFKAQIHLNLTFMQEFVLNLNFIQITFISIQMIMMNVTGRRRKNLYLKTDLAQLNWFGLRSNQIELGWPWLIIIKPLKTLSSSTPKSHFHTIICFEFEFHPNHFHIDSDDHDEGDRGGEEKICI